MSTRLRVTKSRPGRRGVLFQRKRRKNTREELRFILSVRQSDDCEVAALGSSNRVEEKKNSEVSEESEAGAHYKGPTTTFVDSDAGTWSLLASYLAAHDFES